MKIRRNKIKLEKGEQRFGNFICGIESDCIRVADINHTFMSVVNLQTARGQQLKEMLAGAWKSKNKRQFMEAYCTVMMQCSTCVVDYPLLTAMMQDSHDCIFRHKDVYGIKDEISKEEDDKILKEEVELAETEEEVRKEVNGV